jgi:hypothetical protein
MAMPDEWTEIAYVAISDSSKNQYQFGALTDSIELGLGARDIESVALVNAGRVVKFTPDADSEITLELYPVGISSDDTPPNGLLSWFMGGVPTASSGINSYVRLKYRVCALWTDLAKASVTDAAGAIGSAHSFRMSFWGCRMTDHKIDFTDDILKVTCTFKCPAFDKSGHGMIKAEEADATTLATLSDYTGQYPV